MDRYEVLKNSGAYASLMRDVTTHNIAHAYLIDCIDEGMASDLITLFLAAAVFGGDSGLAKAERRGSVDIKSVPQEGESKISVGEVRQIIHEAYYTPVELSKKIFIISKAQTLNDESQNALLKILEEPPAGCMFILSCGNVKKLLPTVLSRVKTVTIPPVSESEIADLMINSYGESEKVYLAAALSKGYLSFADEMMKSDVQSSVYELVLNTLKGMKTSRNILTYSAMIMRKKEHLPLFIDILELVLADCMLAAVGRRLELRFKNAIMDIIELSQGYNDTVVLALRPSIVRARKRLELNGNAQSVLDELLFSLLEVKAKCHKLYQ